MRALKAYVTRVPTSNQSRPQCCQVSEFTIAATAVASEAQTLEPKHLEKRALFLRWPGAFWDRACRLVSCRDGDLTARSSARRARADVTSAAVDGSGPRAPFAQRAALSDADTSARRKEPAMKRAQTQPASTRAPGSSGTNPELEEVSP